MSPVRTVTLTSLTMLAFAGNSLLCRVALRGNGMDAGSFTAVRLIAGAVTLWLLVRTRGGTAAVGGDWLSALALFAYAGGFSYAYVLLPAATGALLLFGAVQVTMIGHGLWAGERLRRLQLVGLLVAAGGVVGLLLPGLSAPPLLGSLLMLGAGAAWGIYSLRGKGLGDPVGETAGNFLRAAPMAAVLSVVMSSRATWDLGGVGYAVLSGAVASGVGYSIWYSVLPTIRATTAATVQLSVPVIAALGGIIFLAEPLTLRLMVASVAVLGGIALVVRESRNGRRADRIAPIDHPRTASDGVPRVNS
jgi:drug/metabolite transporter (DMT)-like permease